MTQPTPPRQSPRAFTTGLLAASLVTGGLLASSLMTSCATTWEEEFATDLVSIWEPILDSLEHVVDTPSAIEAQKILEHELNRLDAFEKKSQATRRPPSKGPSQETNQQLSTVWNKMTIQIQRINKRADTSSVLRSTLRRVQQKRNWSYKGV